MAVMYFFQALTEDSFPGIGETYRPYAVGHLKSVLASQRFGSRTNRLNDYFLALYGETFRDSVLKTDAPGKNLEEEDSLFQARIEYLRHIEEVTRDRGSARDYDKPRGVLNNRSGLETKLSHLLGFEQDREGAARVRLVEHILLRPAGSPFRISVLLPDWPERCKDRDFRTYAEQLVDASCPAHIYADIYWLSAAELDRFDESHEAWWQCYRKSEAIRLSPEKPRADSPEAQNTKITARSLMDFLTDLENRRPVT